MRDVEESGNREDDDETAGKRATAAAWLLDLWTSQLLDIDYWRVRRSPSVRRSDL
jgi:hypothetical protein